MTGSEILEHLPAACEQVLETMFFTGILSAGDYRPAIADDMLSAIVAFSGPPDGRLCACMSRETAAALAASFLGLDSAEVTAAQGPQVAGELANMLCGAVLSRYAPGALLQLASPQVYPRCASARGEYGLCGAFELPEGDLIVCLRVDHL